MAIQQGFVLVRHQDWAASGADGEGGLAQWLPYAESAVACMQAVQVCARGRLLPPADAAGPEPWAGPDHRAADRVGHGAQ